MKALVICPDLLLACIVDTGGISWDSRQPPYDLWSCWESGALDLLIRQRDTAFFLNSARDIGRSERKLKDMTWGISYINSACDM